MEWESKCCLYYAGKNVIVFVSGGLEGDILVFMPGQEDIEATCELVAEKLAALDEVGVIIWFGELWRSSVWFFHDEDEP